MQDLVHPKGKAFLRPRAGLMLLPPRAEGLKVDGELAVAVAVAVAVGSGTDLVLDLLHRHRQVQLLDRQPQLLRVEGAGAVLVGRFERLANLIRIGGRECRSLRGVVGLLTVLCAQERRPGCVYKFATACTPTVLSGVRLAPKDRGFDSEPKQIMRARLQTALMAATRASGMQQRSRKPVRQS